jgi:hypothetical protein
MPIVRTYQCEACFNRLEVTLAAEEWNAPPPDCPHCAERTQQEFTPPRINGSPSARANAIAESIAERDFGVSDIHRDHRAGSTPKVEYRDDMMGVPKRQGRQPGVIPATPSHWGASQAAVEQAAAIGRDTRLRFGNGLDVLQSALKSGAQPDLIEQSKRRSARIW